jgi:hypothetical protein
MDLFVANRQRTNNMAAAGFEVVLVRDDVVTTIHAGLMQFARCATSLVLRFPEVVNPRPTDTPASIVAVVLAELARFKMDDLALRKLTVHLYDENHADMDADPAFAAAKDAFMKWNKNGVIELIVHLPPN